MRLSSLLSSFTLAAALLSSPLVARAQHGPPPPPPGHGHGHGEESDYPLSYVERPLTLPRLALSPVLELDVTHVTTTANNVLAGMNIGASFGITRDLEVGAMVAPITFAPVAGYGATGEPDASLQFFGTFRFFHHHVVEMGARLRTYILTPKGLKAGAVIQPSVPFLFHFGRLARLDAEVGVPIYVNAVSEGGGAVELQTTHVGLSVPVSFSIDIIEPLHVGVRTGVDIVDFGHTGEAENFSIPLGIFAGFAIGGKRPFLDIDPFFRWRSFITPGSSGPGSEKIHPGIWTVGLEARGYIYFGG